MEILQIIGFIAAFLTCHALANAQEDSGSVDPVALFLNTASNFSSDPTIAQLTLPTQEIMIRSRMNLGTISMEEGASQLYVIARSHWDKRNYDEVFRVAELAIDAAPNSYGAAQSWMLIGDTWYGNKADPTRSVEPLRKAETVLELLAKEPDNLAENSKSSIIQSQAILAGRLGFATLYGGDSEASRSNYERLINRPEFVQAVDPNTVLSAYRYLLGFAAEKKDLPLVISYGEAANKFAADRKLPPSIRISIQLEVIRKSYPDPSDSLRLKALEEMWRRDEFRLVPEILDVGDELCLSYFFFSPIKRQEFATTSRLMRRRMVLLRATEPDLKSLLSDSVYIRHGLMAIDFSTRFPGEDVDAKALNKEFDKLSSQGEIQISVPGSRESADANRIGATLLSILVRNFPEQGKGRLQSPGE